MFETLSGEPIVNIKTFFEGRSNRYIKDRIKQNKQQIIDKRMIDKITESKRKERRK